MRVHVFFFASLRERQPEPDVWVEVSPNTTVKELYDELCPAPRPPVAFTQNQVIVPGSTVLSSEDEISFLPPYGGG